jgi:hypothetical protein
MNFKTLEIEIVGRYKELPIKLELNDRLDLKYSVFTELVFADIKNAISQSQLDKYDNPIIFQVYTDIPRSELKFIRDIIIAALVDNMIVTKETYKHGERRLGIPEKLKGLEIMDGHIMDLVNYPLLKEQFEIQFYDEKSRLYKPVIKLV